MPEFVPDKLTVIIPACDEEKYIADVLDALPVELSRPIVAINGSKDRTAAIASEYGATVRISEAQGKLPAIQDALCSLGREALGPIAILDGDTRPIMPKRWCRGMMRLLTADQSPVVIGGPVWYTRNGPPRNRIIHSIWRAQRAYHGEQPDSDVPAVQYGPNMGVAFRDAATLDRIMALDHLWPGEDMAIADEVVAGGGKFIQSISSDILTATPLPKSLGTLKDRLRDGRELTGQKALAAYMERGADGSVPYYKVRV